MSFHEVLFVQQIRQFSITEREYENAQETIVRIRNKGISVCLSVYSCKGRYLYFETTHESMSNDELPKLKV